MMFSAGQIVAHLVGDYVIQSDWMAVAKTKRSGPAIIHAASYAMPFLFITRAPGALAMIIFTHYVIDRWRLARYLCWLKNFIGSPWSREQLRALAAWAWSETFTMTAVPEVIWTPWRRPWSECEDNGYPAGRPIWLTGWLAFIADNCLHLLCNGVAIWDFAG